MTVAAIILPIFSIALAGYLSARVKLVAPADGSAMMRYVFNFAVPLLLFQTLSGLEIPVQIEWGLLLGYYLAAGSMYLLAMWIGRSWFKMTRAGQAVYAFANTFSNMMLVGLPIVLAAFGEQGALPLTLIISIHTAVFTVLITVFAGQNSLPDAPQRGIAHSLVTSLAGNPIIWGLAGGLLANRLGWALGGPLGEAATLVGRSVSPVALFAMGVSLSQYRFSEHSREAWATAAIKLALQPLLVWLLVAQVFHINPMWAAVATLAAGLPTGVTAAAFAHKYEANVAAVTSATLLTTLLAIPSLSLILYLLL